MLAAGQPGVAQSQRHGDEGGGEQQVQDENARLKDGYRKIIMATMYVTFTLMLGMAAFSESMIVTLIGKKWLPAVQFLQLLCLAAMLYPLQALNLNIFFFHLVKPPKMCYLRVDVTCKIHQPLQPVGVGAPAGCFFFCAAKISLMRPLP